MPRGGWSGAGRERTWALVSACAEGISIRARPRRPGCHPPGVYRLAADADLDALDAALSELRAGRPRGSRCGGTIADRLSDEWIGCGSARTGSYTWTLAATRRLAGPARRGRRDLAQRGPCPILGAEWERRDAVSCGQKRSPCPAESI